MADPLAQMLEMGFPEDRARKALAVCKNNVGAAMDWLFNNPDAGGSDSGTGTSAGAVAPAGFSIGTKEDLEKDKDKVKFASELPHEYGPWLFVCTQ
jgi:hypothetical protein